MDIMLAFILGIVVGYVVSAMVYLTSKDSISGWKNSCTGDCNQGRNCNCVEIKK